MESTLIDRSTQASLLPEIPVGQKRTVLALKIVLATLAAFFCSRVLNQTLMGESLMPLSPVEGVGQLKYVSLTLFASLLAAAALSFAATRSSLYGIALIQALAIAHFGLLPLLAMVEAAVYLPEMPASDIGLGVFEGAINAVVLAICLVIALGRTTSSTVHSTSVAAVAPMSWWEWLWKFALCSLSYLILYFVAGMLVYPFVKQYFVDMDLENLDPLFLVGLQIRRGAVYVACLVPLVRSMRASRWRITLTAAVILPVVHGSALLIPNEHMPLTMWRVAHMIEIGWSNFVFGLLIGYLFSRKVQDTQIAE